MALKTVTEQRTGQRAVYEGSGENMYVSGAQDYQYDWVTGWTSEETGQFYELAPAGFEAYGGYEVNGRQALNASYVQQREQVVKQMDWDYQLAREREQIEAQNAAQRAEWQSQLQAQADAFTQQQAEAQRQQAAQAAQFEAERAAREAERVAAEKAKQEKLAAEQKISSETMLGDMLRVANVKDNDLVAQEDKKVLGADDKQQLFAPGQQDEEEKTKAKQSLLERIMTSGVTGAPKQ